MTELTQEHLVTVTNNEYETLCWGCGLRLLLPSSAPIFKCGWCGAITNQKIPKREDRSLWWRRLRDKCFICVLLVFMLFVICGGVWALYPIVFSIGLFCGIFHSIITLILSIITISSFSLSAFQCAGPPPNIVWGSYPVVGKHGLENYTFCRYCSKPKSPRTHHCRSCGMCVLDMDHHCPFIGNCVGAANHRHFIIFLISAVISTFYVSIMCVYAAIYIWPPFTYKLDRANVLTGHIGLRTIIQIITDVIVAWLSSVELISARTHILVYLFISSISVEIGLSILLWQQLCYIYKGNTYLSSLTSQGDDRVGEKDCQNLIHFFNFPYSLQGSCRFFRIPKRHSTTERKYI